MPLGASSQPLKAGYRPTTGSSELRSHPPARLLSCGAAAAPRSPGEAAGGHFLPHRPRAPRRSRSPAERPPPRDLPRRCPPRETARSVLPPLGCAKLKAMKQRKGQKQRTAAPRTRDGMGGRPDGGHGPASPSAPRRLREEPPVLTRLPTVGAAAVPGDLQQLLQQRLVAVAVHHRRPARSSAGGARREARPRHAKGGTPWGPPRAEEPPQHRTGSR